MAKKEIKNKSKVAKKTAAPKQVSSGRVYVTATFNNTLVTLTDSTGNTLAWGSAGGSGFKGARKATPFAAITAMEKVASKAKTFGMTAVEVYIKGPGPGRDASIRALRSAGLNITMIADVTPVPYNGPRAKKKRRV
ncbi:30S ribosomal protein S11 [Candidatus Daviesbacteria bacterium RIFCSPLOWO2_01_FULL_43_38]|uniref:Small ribosomal subunit protein uS11 n=2 Tax=Candidatus Daviesiibacteriota TaxID=1752718 RepID=A0A1F5K841_9BACT|nr:MAG: 30S ribosomal protein S11 [Candidatus Daviesbacteria bacterium GW2011_GWA2_42_7]OGE20398.1 MAG: 30S ribosomal protein S11 [Candidatus Daviesbacteria bacterium RIFCSPHIGHO2_01_FULL_43_17]OGE37004.1 MAG: 30S ribosomal protein S11 [Candidatus Daviesbacteria bacterium RIFCSPHIGHO2_12_FULL_43_11]OGE63928.1 MAG: 30S ribosomal protein S11 [Candidatus Daviesbacteria bacterium RIFCSPLOWO2_01_FULL_43_38]OGE69011.1 MAG: 30S ribosomal protein S11 [Candidatus Daviesbacteria bacterium RIFCSPLOWO2_02_